MALVDVHMLDLVVVFDMDLADVDTANLDNRLVLEVNLLQHLSLKYLVLWNGPYCPEYLVCPTEIQIKIN